MAIAALQPLLTDPAVRDEALVRVGQMQIALGRHREALDALAEAAQRTTSPTVKFLAFFLSGRARDALKQPEEAMHAFKQALAVIPHAESADVALASLQFVHDRRADAAVILQRVADRRSPAPDPGRLVGYGSFMHWPSLVAAMRAELQK